jgi:hypothetical protein
VGIGLLCVQDALNVWNWAPCAANTNNNTPMRLLQQTRISTIKKDANNSDLEIDNPDNAAEILTEPLCLASASSPDDSALTQLCVRTSSSPLFV